MYGLYFRHILILLIGMSMSACSLVSNELKTAEQLIETAPDSALHILRDLSPDNYASGANRALYGLLMIQTLDKKMLPLKPDSLLDFSIAWYERHPDKDRLAACYLYKGRSLKFSFQYEKASGYYFKALDAVKNKENYLLLGRIYSDIGDIYLYQREYTQANQKYLQAYKFFIKANLTTFAHYSLINLGVSLSQAKLYKNAQLYLQKVYKESKDSLVIGFAIQDIGINYYKSKEYDSALFFLRKSIKYPYIKTNQALRLYYLADLCYDLKQIDSANYYALNAFKYEIDIRTKRECYRILANVEGLKKNLNAVSKYMSNYQDCSDSIRKIDAQTKGSYIETVHNSTKEVVKANHKMGYLYVLLAFIVILSVTVFFMIRKRNKKEKLEVEQIHLQQKAKMHKEVLINHREVLQNKIQERKNMLAPERKKANQAGKIAIDRKVYEELLHINDTEYFYDEMNSVLNNLVNKLNNLYPTLTPREVMWCCLSLLQVSSTDMYLLLEINVDSLKKMKQRLAPKFNLALVSELENYLINLIFE